MGSLPRLSGQKRRLIIVGLLVLVAALIRIGPTFDTAFLTVLAIGIAMAILHLIPAIRRWLECSALALALLAALPVPADLYFSLSIAAAAVIFHFLHGSWPRRSSLRFGLANERTAKAKLPLTATWQRAVPGSGHPDDFWTGTLVDFEADPHDPLTIYIRYRNAYGLYSEATLTFIEREPPTYCRFILEPEYHNGEDERIFSIRLSEVGEFETLIETRVDISGLTLAQAATLWLDDNLGDEMGDMAETTLRRQKWVAEWPGLREVFARKTAVEEPIAGPAPDAAEMELVDESWAEDGAIEDMTDLTDNPPPAPARRRSATPTPRPPEQDFKDDFDILSVIQTERDIA